MDDEIRAQTIVVLTSGKGLEHALIIRRNKHGNKVGPLDETGNLPDISFRCIPLQARIALVEIYFSSMSVRLIRA